MSITGPHPLEDRRRRVLLIASLGSFMGPVDVSVVAVALPDLGDALGLSLSAALWVQAGYLFSYALALIPIGRLADQWGRIAVWRLGVAVFVIGSLGAGLAVNDPMLIAWRLFQGVGGGMLSATATAMVSAVYPASMRGRALGITIAALYLGLSLGPLIGGLLVQHAGWRWIFLVNVPLGALALAVAAPLREARPRAGRPTLDPLGNTFLGIALVGLLVGVTFGPLWGWSSTRVIALLVTGAVFTVAFLLVEGRVRAPMIDLSLFRRSKIYGFGNGAALLNYTAIFGCISLTALLMELVGERSPTHTGMVLIIQPACMVAVTPLAGRLSDRIGSRELASGGVGGIAGGLAALAILPAGLPMGHLAAGLVMVGVGMGMFSSPNTSAVMGAAPRADYGVAAAVLGLMRTLGQSFSLAILGAIAAAPLGAAGADVLAGSRDADVPVGMFLDGYRAAMATAAVIALVGSGFSLARGARER
ncbi:MAG TPA: MFS transporter [Miltoncostaeaceae bacterium]|nr:MFS transporter [Miltoncostaeaceae bacterium]